MKFPPWTSVSEAASLLKEGEVVAIPTETVYALQVSMIAGHGNHHTVIRTINE